MEKLKGMNYQTILTLFICAHIITFTLADFYLNGVGFTAFILQTIISILALTGVFIKDKFEQVSKDLTAIAIGLTPAVLVYILANHPWQIDAHMYFFAMLAMVTGLKSIRALLMAATAIALHHLSLNFLMPSLIFPDGTDFIRVIFHAVIVVVETSVIALTIYGLNKNDATIKEEVENSKAALKQAKEAEEEQKRLEIEAAEQKRKTMKDMADAFENRMGGLISEMNNASGQILNLSNELNEALEQTRERGTTASQSSDEASQNVQTVAAATEELSASIQEISRNVAAAADLARLCADDAQISETKLSDLQNAVGEIDVVIQSINDVAEQTNLLALNATIEAARAGEAGKGFAVVANEVKTLANETHKMTDEISAKVHDIKSSAGTTITTMRDILEKIRDVNTQTTSIASAIEQQNSATEEISRNIQKAATGTADVSENMTVVQILTEEGAKSTQDLKNSSHGLANLSNKLKETADSFIVEIRTR